jgi:hypothetical protein
MSARSTPASPLAAAAAAADASTTAVATTAEVVATAASSAPEPTAADGAPPPRRRRGRPPKAVAGGAVAPGASPPTTAPPRPARPGLSVRGLAACASDRARLVAAMVLEVLCAARTPAEAAAVLAVVPVRYYQLEARALAGLIAGCEPASRGRPAVGSADDRLRSDHARLLAENRRLTGELGRLQTLLRTARTAFGLRPEVAPAPAPGGRGAGAKPGRRRPRVRALRLAGVVRPAASTAAAPLATVATILGGG